MHPILAKPWEYIQEPFPVTDHVFYVGNTWVGSYLFDSGEGLILLDCGMPQTVYQIFESIRLLKRDPKDIRLILLSHAHYDHCGGAEAIRRYTGAQTILGREDMRMIDDPELKLADDSDSPPFLVNKVYNDHEPIRMGRFVIQTVHTPGHTEGARSFFFTDTADGKSVRCGMHGGIGFGTMTDEFMTKHSLPFSLRNDFLTGLRKLREYPVDVTLGSHPKHVLMLERLHGAKDTNPFVDASIWPAFMDDRINAFRKEHPELSV